MRKTLFLTLLLCVAPGVSGCALSDVFYNLFGHAYSGGGSNDAARYADYNQRVQATSASPSIPGASSNPFSP